MSLRDELAEIIKTTCNGCFSPDHPCGDPVCDIREEVRRIWWKYLAEKPKHEARKPHPSTQIGRP